jgi:hypothetical protein
MTAGASRNAEGFTSCGFGRERSDPEDSPGQKTDPFTGDLGGGMAKAEVTDRAQPAGQDVAQVAANELDARDGLDA